MAHLATVCSATTVSRRVCASCPPRSIFFSLSIAPQWPQTSCRGHSSCSSNHAPSGANYREVCHAAPGVADQAVPNSHIQPEDDWLQRSRLLVGADGLAKLAAVNLLLVGLGGVGSFAAEFLCRAGVSQMTIVDGDTIDTTNRNRQLPALKSTVGLSKAEVVAGRLRDINPNIQLTVKQEFLDPIRASALVQEQQYQYVVDCIDSVAPKQALLLVGHKAGCKVVSSMGAGGRLDPSRVQLADISETYNDAFAAVVRRGLRKAGVSNGVTVVFSSELAKPASLALTQQQYKKSYFGTSSYIPALFGLYIASHIIRDVVEPDYNVPGRAAAVSTATIRNGKHGSRNGRSSKGTVMKPSKQQRTAEQLELLDADSSLDSSHQQLQQLQQQKGSMVVDATTNPCPVTTTAGTRGPDSQMMHVQQNSMVESYIFESGASDAVSSHQQESNIIRKDQDVRHLLRSFEQSKGVGVGYDGDGI